MRGSAFAILFGTALLMSAGAAQASVTISAAATKNMTCSAGVCSPTAKKAVLNVGDLTNMLASEDVKITTGAGAVTITIAAPFSWTSTHRLTLDANYNVSFRASVTVAGQGGVTMTYNDGGSGGDLVFFPGAKLDFWDTSSSLIINAKPFVFVSNLRELENGIKQNHAGKFALNADYDASADGTYAAPPIEEPLQGTFEGLGHSIENLSIVTPSAGGVAYVGLFAELGRGTVRNVGVTNFSIDVHSDSGTRFSGYLGALVALNGQRKGVGSVRNTYASGTISTDAIGGYIGGLVGLNGSVAGTVGSVVNSYCGCKIVFAEGSGSYTGGLVGYNVGIISNSSANVDIAGDVPAGGLVGANYGHVIGSYAAGTMNDDNAGGLASLNDVGGIIEESHSSVSIRWAGRPASAAFVLDNLSAKIVNCYATGDSELGAVGFNAGSIESSFATGVATGLGEVGGLVAENEGSISNSYALGEVKKGRIAMGGLVGQLYGGTVSSSYSIGHVSGGKPAHNGGLIGVAVAGQTENSYWDRETSGERRSAGGKSLSDARLRAELPAGFDPKIWGQGPGINNGYPYLLANPPPQ